jgi:hypothetical protein
MTVIVTGAAAAPGHRFPPTAALANWLASLAGAAWPAPSEFGPIRRAAIACRSRL